MPQTMTTASTIGQIIKHLKIPFKPKSHANSNPSATNCRLCQGLHQCQFPSHIGFQPIGNALSQCRHLSTWKLQRRHSNLQQGSDIPQSYRNLTFKDFQLNDNNSAAFSAALELSSLFLSGPSGTGKTLLLSLIGNEHIKRNRHVQYSTTAEMLLHLRYNNDSCEDRLRHYQSIHVLLLDDLGAERQSDYGEEQLYMVLEGRHRHNLTTVISSAYALSDLSHRYNPHLQAKVKQLTQREASLY